MFITMRETLQENSRPVTDELTELLAGFGFDADRLDVELAIDRFDQWTNPRQAILVPSSGVWHGTELERAA